MSVIIGAMVESGIVIASDRRIETNQDRDGKREYDDDMCRIVPFHNRIAVAYCGNDRISVRYAGESRPRETFINTFLTGIREMLGHDCAAYTLPGILLKEYRKIGGHGDVTFVVGGYLHEYGPGILYAASTKYGDVTSFTRSSNRVIVSGCNEIGHAMMDGCDYHNMSMQGCIGLAKAAIDATILAHQYTDNPVAKGPCDMYIISPLKTGTGWVRDGQIIPDENVNNDACKLSQNEYLKQSGQVPEPGPQDADHVDESSGSKRTKEQLEATRKYIREHGHERR